MKNKFIFLTIAMLVLLIIVTSCGEDDNPTTPPEEQNTTGTITDNRDNKTYKWVEIGDQIWMAENLAYKPSNGNYIAHENNESNIDIYGYLYDWSTTQNVAMEGWHIPSEAEWLELVDFLGGTDVAGGKMREIGTTHWNSSITGIDNSSGFTARAGGLYDSTYDNFVLLGRSANWWSSTDGYGDNNEAAFVLTIYDGYIKTSRGAHNKSTYQSVRCIKD